MNKKILIIEDDENITCLERDYLEAHGFEVLCANDGLKGLEIAKTVNVAFVCFKIFSIFQIAEVLRRINTVAVHYCKAAF